jgi:hypothetical protein
MSIYADISAASGSATNLSTVTWWREKAAACQVTGGRCHLPGEIPWPADGDGSSHQPVFSFSRRQASGCSGWGVRQLPGPRRARV